MQPFGRSLPCFIHTEALVGTSALTQGVCRDGTIPAGSANYPGNGEGEGANPGSISVWAQATSVTKETKTGVDSTQDFGTSYSSPEVVRLPCANLYTKL